MNLKEKVQQSLQNTDFPDFDFLYWTEVLEQAWALLDIFLSEEKQQFKDTLALDNNDITFDSFQSFSALEVFWAYLEHYKSVSNNDAIRKIIEDFEPKIIDFSNEISYSKRYFEMYQYCFEHTPLTPEQSKIISDTIRNYKIKWIDLDTTKQQQLKQISSQLSELSTQFSNNSLDSENQFEYYIESDQDIQELPVDILAGAKKRAWKKTWYLFSSDPSEYVAIMKYCTDAQIRKDFYSARWSVASSGKYDNREIVLNILTLKHKKAQLLGYKNYAELSLEFKMAESPQQVIQLTQDVASRATPKAKDEIKMLKQHFQLTILNDWDISYYMRKYKQELYQIDDTILKPYFEYNRVLQWLHSIVEKLYGITMKKIPILNPLLDKEEEETNEVSQDRYTNKIEIYEVYKDDILLSYYFLDAFYRPEKRSGAWANNIRPRFAWSLPVMLNVCNFSPVDQDGISLLTKNDVETLFHEFGHALHEMSSRSQHSELSGFGVEWDFVEVPSQFMEHWTETKESLDMFAIHYQTDQKIPEALLKNMEISSQIGNGLWVLGQCTYTLMDMLLHSDALPETVEQLDQKTLEIINTMSLNPKSEDYKMYTSFGHIFAGWYAAGYYSYMWAEMLELDIWREFQKNGIFDTKTAQHYFDTLLSAGSQDPASQIFKNCMWRDLDLQWFFNYKGI